MKFRFAARVIAQLGAELISSDDIAVYELIKNGFDAGSSRVKLEIRYLVGVESIARLQGDIRGWFLSEMKLPAVRKATAAAIAEMEPIGSGWGEELQVQKERVIKAIAEAKQEDQFISLVGTLNQITITDIGHGMDQGSLQNCFLTIGTTNRLKEHEELAAEEEEESNSRPQGEQDDEVMRAPAGEKGIGRLSAMRLGNDLQVRTWTEEAEEESLLIIDWRVFSPESPFEADEIEMPVETRLKSEDDPPSGTVLSITDLQSPWDQKKTTDVATKFLSRFLDPFEANASRGVDILWNGEEIEIPLMARRYLDASQNGMKGKVTFDSKGRFTLTVDYWFQNSETGRRKALKRTYSSADFGGITDAAIADVGAFSFEFYHYNRMRVAAIPGVATRKEFKDWLDDWAGGLMLYRDGLRVMPYGCKPDDDWLELDRHALRRSGYRVNRIQVVGCVRISRKKNPRLKDQTNREGLRDNATATTFRKFLQKII